MRREQARQRRLTRRRENQVSRAKRRAKRLCRFRRHWSPSKAKLYLRFNPGELGNLVEEGTRDGERSGPKNASARDREHGEEDASSMCAVPSFFATLITQSSAALIARCYIPSSVCRCVDALGRRLHQSWEEGTGRPRRTSRERTLASAR